MAHIYPRPILRSKSCRYLRSIPEADSLPQALSPERWQAVRSMDIPDLYCWTLGTGKMFPTAIRELFSYTGRFLQGSLSSGDCGPTSQIAALRWFSCG